MSLKISWNKETGLLDIINNNLPDLSCINFDDYPNIKILNCNNNKLISLDNLPISLKNLYCNNNQLTSLDNLPINIKILDCANNQITSLNNLPINLKELYCWNNQIKLLDNLPINLKKLDCDNNQLKSLDNLPINLKKLYCCNNQIKLLDKLPINLELLYCDNNPLDAKYKHLTPDDIIKLNKELRKKEQYAEYINNERLKAVIYLKYIALNFNEIIPLDIINEIINFIV
jgi:Leucine-rich repeat (LRR) protein